MCGATQGRNGVDVPFCYEVIKIVKKGMRRRTRTVHKRTVQ